MRGPSTGSSCGEEFEARTGEVWPLNVGQVYTTLQRLERDGLVESDGDGQDGPQKDFRITAAGTEELTGWLRTPSDMSSPPRDELVMKVLVALRVPGIDVRDVIQVHRRYLVGLMQQWTRIKEAEADSDMSLALVVDAELFRLDAVVRWLDAADGRIKRGADPSADPRQGRQRGRHRPYRRCGAGLEYEDERAGAAARVDDLRPGGRRGARAARRRPDRSTRASMVAVMGPSGSGKSTLLTIAGSLEEPSSGEVCVCGVELAELSRNARARLRRRSIGYVFQDFNLLPGLTAAENVALPLELDGVPARKARVAGLAALEELGLADRAASFPDQLSGGERQRVAIARAVVGDRRLLLADEPSGALDSVNGEAVMRLIHAACKRGVAAVVVTHDAQLASWADRVVFLRDGRVTDQTLPAPGPESLLTPGPGQ